MLKCENVWRNLADFFNAERCTKRFSWFLKHFYWIPKVQRSDALRCVPARRVLKLSRINGFHLYDVLHAQQFLFVLVVNLKKGKVTGITKQDKKGDFAVLTRTCRAECYLHHPGAMPRVTGFIF